MRIHRPSRSRLEAAFDGMDLQYEDAFDSHHDGQADSLGGLYSIGETDFLSDEVELMIEDFDLELAAAELAAAADFRFEVAGQVRGHRGARRTGRTVLRSLPTGLAAVEFGQVDGQAA